jgi:pyrroline-5-carboxylate reductase
MEIVLIGAGNMGSAMLAGLSSYSVTVVERDSQKAAALKEKYSDITVQSVAPDITAKVVILAIKPQSLESLELFGKAEAVISILAGTPIANIKKIVDAEYYIRAMPNVAALKQKSVTSVVGDSGFKEEALKILSTIGTPIWLKSEKELDIATGLAASSPAWLAIVAEALADGAVNLGLGRAESYAYLGGLFEGVGALLKEMKPAEFKDIVSSPGGTTIAGVAALEERAVRAAFIEAMASCYDRALELGKKE